MRWQIRPLMLVVALSTLAAMSLTMLLVSAGGAATPEKEYSANFEAECLITATGLSPQHGKMKLNIQGMGPSQVNEDERVALQGLHEMITMPAAWSTDVVDKGLSSATGFVTSLEVEGEDTELQTLNLALGTSGFEALPFQTPVVSGKEATFTLPSGPHAVGMTSYTSTPFNVIGEPGGTMKLELSPFPGFEGNSDTGEGIQLGVREEGGVAVKAGCTAPAGVVLGEAPIVGRIPTTATVTTTRATRVTHTRSSITTSSASPTTTTATSSTITTTTTTTTTSLPPFVRQAEYSGWSVTGALSIERHHQTIALPAGASFNGSSELNLDTGSGEVKGAFSIPPFATTLKLFGVVPVRFGMTIADTSPLEGMITQSKTVPGEETLSLPVRLSIGVTSVSVLGLTVPTTCTVQEPLSLDLIDNLTPAQLLEEGWSFAGTTSFAPFKCAGGLLGELMGEILTTIASGPANTYSLAVTAPKT